jgi:glutamine amidotransferase
MAKKLTLIDAGTGNLRSVFKALNALGAQVLVTSDPADVARGGRLVLPGVGAFGDFMSGLRERGLEAPVLKSVGRGDPLLGICVGMQALFESSDEMGTHTGLGLLPGVVTRFEETPGLKVPHTGWNKLNFERNSPLWAGLEPGDYVYFNHAYYCAAANSEHAAASTLYGIQFTSAVQRGALFGVQFHPEKSQRVGLKILENFIYAT